MYTISPNDMIKSINKTHRYLLQIILLLHNSFYRTVSVPIHLIFMKMI